MRGVKCAVCDVKGLVCGVRCKVCGAKFVPMHVACHLHLICIWRVRRYFVPVDGLVLL